MGLPGLQLPTQGCHLEPYLGSPSTPETGGFRRADAQPAALLVRRPSRASGTAQGMSKHRWN